MRCSCCASRRPALRRFRRIPWTSSTKISPGPRSSRAPGRLRRNKRLTPIPFRGRPAQRMSWRPRCVAGTRRIRRNRVWRTSRLRTRKARAAGRRMGETRMPRFTRSAATEKQTETTGVTQKKCMEVPWRAMGVRTRQRTAQAMLRRQPPTPQKTTRHHFARLASGVPWIGSRRRKRRARAAPTVAATDRAARVSWT